MPHKRAPVRFAGAGGVRPHALISEGRDASVLRGHVKDEMEGIGLGVEFAGLTEEEQTTIRDIVDLRTEK